MHDFKPDTVQNCETEVTMGKCRECCQAPTCHFICGCFFAVFAGMILIIVGVQLLSGVVDYENAKVDHCEFNGYTSTVTCRIDNSGGKCEGIKHQYYYDTINGTCDGNNTLYYEDESCDCFNRGPPFVTVNDTATKCWINECEGKEGETWTLINPEDIKDGMIAWTVLSVGIFNSVIGVLFCGNCCRLAIKQRRSNLTMTST